MSNNVQYVGGGGGKQTKKRNQNKYPKPTQQIYRPPSARIETVTGTTTSATLATSTGSYRNSCISMYNHPSDVFLIKPQPSPSSSYLGNVTSNVFPIRGVLKRSKSVGNNNNNNNNKNKNFDNKIHEYHYLDETLAGTFFLTLENISRDNLNLLKLALDRDTCSSVTMNQLLQIIRILCNKVLEKPINAAVMAKVCLEIHHNQQMNMIQLSDHKYLFLESLANCLREWFNERDKLRFTTGGAKRWTAYIMFLMELYLNLKETVAKDLEMAKYYSNISDSNSLNDVDDDDGDASSEEEEEDDDEIVRTFALNNNKSNESSANDSSQADSSSCKSGSSERFSIKKTSSSNSIEAKIMGSLLAKQQKQFAHLILDSFQVILSNPNSTPAEIECMQTVFRKCGKYLEEDNPSRIKSIIFLIRDILLNYSNANQFINANNNCSQNASISKSLLEIVELASSGWRFNHAQQIYYFPYTRID